MTGKSRKTVTRQCQFTNSRGLVLDGRLDLPADTDLSAETSFIIFCHCFTCSKETITTFRLSRLLAAAGFAVLRFDFTGLGSSEGDFSTTTFRSTQDDLRSAINFLRDNYSAPDFIMGHSLGGTTALSLAQEYEHIKGVVTIASPSEPDHVLHHFGHALTLLEQGINASFEVAGQFFDIQPGFVDDVRQFDMSSQVSELKKPTLIFNIENDTLVGASNADELQRWIAGEVTRIDVHGSDHLLSNRDAVDHVAQDIVKWISNVS
jgi:esterase/lipase